jgi:hypothetical protein
VHLRTRGACTLARQEAWYIGLQDPDSPHRYWLAEDGDRPVGYGGLTYINNGAAEIAWLLEPGRGDDKALLHLLIAKAVERGLRLLYSEPRPICPLHRYLALQAAGFHGSPHRLVLSLV